MVPEAAPTDRGVFFSDIPYVCSNVKSIIRGISFMAFNPNGRIRQIDPIALGTQRR
jgi:hypothetical protein